MNPYRYKNQINGKEGKALPYRMAVNKCRQKDGNRPSLLDKYWTIIVANKIHWWMLTLICKILRKNRIFT